MSKPNLGWDTPIFDLSDMMGKTFSRVFVEGNDQVWFVSDTGDMFVFHHHQDCCEYVGIKDVVGDLADLVGSPLLESECITKNGKQLDDYGTETWTFYKFGTIKGHVNISWYGESNGYYSESVDQSFIEGGKN